MATKVELIQEKARLEKEIEEVKRNADNKVKELTEKINGIEEVINLVNSDSNLLGIQHINKITMGKTNKSFDLLLGGFKKSLDDGSIQNILENYERIVVYKDNFNSLFTSELRCGYGSNNYSLICEIRFSDKLYKEVRENGLSDKTYDELLGLYHGLVSMAKDSNVDLPTGYNVGDKVMLNKANGTITRSNRGYTLNRIESFTDEVLITKATIKFGKFEEFDTRRFH